MAPCCLNVKSHFATMSHRADLRLTYMTQKQEQIYSRWSTRSRGAEEIGAACAKVRAMALRTKISRKYLATLIRVYESVVIETVPHKNAWNTRLCLSHQRKRGCHTPPMGGMTVSSTDMEKTYRSYRPNLEPCTCQYDVEWLHWCYGISPWNKKRRSCWLRVFESG